MKELKIRIGLLMLGLFISFFAQAQLRDGDIVKIKNVNSGKYACPKGLSNQADVNMVIYAGNSSSFQNWKVVLVPKPRYSFRDGNTYYRFMNVSTGLYLSSKDGSKESYGVISQNSENSDPGLDWRVTQTTNGFYIINKKSQRYAAVAGISRDEEAMMIQRPYDGQPDMVWQFQPVGSASTSDNEGRKVLYDIVLHYIAVAEATRNRIDNGDCKRTYGQIRTELWELDENNEMKTRLQSYNNMPELLYDERNKNNPPTLGLSYYQDDVRSAAMTVIKKITYNIPENLLDNRKLMLVVKTFLGTRHKDNDFATYDALGMLEEKQTTYILDNRRSVRTEKIEGITDLTASNRSVHLQDWVIPNGFFSRNTDDTHKVWIYISIKKKY